MWSLDSTIGCHWNGTTVPLWNSSHQLNWMTTADYFHGKRIQRGLIRATLDARGDLRLAGKEGARRFELQIPLRYRVNGDSKWRRRVMKDIGCS